MPTYYDQKKIWKTRKLLFLIRQTFSFQDQFNIMNLPIYSNIYAIEGSHTYTIDLRRRMLESVTLPLHKSERSLIGDTAARCQMNAEDIYYEERENIWEHIHARRIAPQRKCSMRDKAEISKQHWKTIKFFLADAISCCSTNYYRRSR